MIRVYVEKTDGFDGGKAQSAEGLNLLAFAFKKDFDIDVSKLIMSRAKYGKPYFENCPYHFNISHSGEYVVCAISDYEVGVDVQKIRVISPKLMKRFLCSDETDPAEQTRLWTRYESLGKCLGKGIPHKLDESRYFFIEKSLKDAYVSICSVFEDDDVKIVMLYEPSL